jgi:hypothetical protein
MPIGDVRTVTETFNRLRRGVRPRRLQRQPCDTCGSSEHTTARCVGRDDLVLGTTSPGTNGPYKGTLPVRVLPPGFSYLDRFDGEAKPKPEPGQVWYSPLGKAYVLIRVRARVVTMKRRAAKSFASRETTVAKSRLERTWYFGGREVARG